MKIAILTKSNNEEGHAKQNELALFLVQNGILCMKFDTDECANLSTEQTIIFLNELKECDAIVVFGGDGTVLRAVSMASLAGIPILSVNLGDMGFLSELERNATPVEILEAIKTFGIDTRSLIEVSNEKDIKMIALNDVVLKTGGATPVYISASVNGELIDKYRSDGVIVSTPTGSTAYSLSAGGPVIAPDVDGIVVIPVCPHTLHSRPIVLSSNSVVELFLEKENEKANLIVDGKLVCSISGNTKLKITKSNYTALFLRKNYKGFYSRLLQKMNIWGVSNS